MPTGESRCEPSHVPSDEPSKEPTAVHFSERLIIKARKEKKRTNSNAQSRVSFLQPNI
jgi:hypothetical protein